ncbi:isocitrate lyase/PEP mutase family protein [Goodfellowiella coeruleoviolacea]|uniref:2-Methylisocitrate lyase, PEP mutase family n=1 Tax=Goodfellowiella coeruleoviolacea TaxID=334858 RepID=A0AAE3GKE8_9PSEU|nr:isocitrate lyase/phosphoenolpyruvate mutase family protein [Goodfellowiella coeruleoviolacea]MCP2169077.1 2-Methylisocitrate lyase, PEP mutase family [Goodfellowiella coeruleoviolacea]
MTSTPPAPTTAQHRALQDKALLFHSLHTSGQVLALPNAWDVASALLVQQAGASAVATTSAGVAWSLGAADGDHLDRDRALDLVARIASAVSVPVTADIERGFAATPDGVADTIRGVLAAGAVGVNLEDSVDVVDEQTGQATGRGLRAAGEQADRIAAARQAADAAGVRLFINARVDTYLLGVGETPELRFAETVDRAAAYLRAGANGIFVPGVVDPATVADLVKQVAAPLNVLAGPGAPAVPDLAALGVARVSLGSGIAEAAYAVARRSAEEMLRTGTYTALAEAAEAHVDYGQLNALEYGLGN